MRRHWFLPETPDVIGTLSRQAEVTVTGLTAMVAWACGAGTGAPVREAEHQADAIRRELAGQLRVAFSTPVDQEDLFTLSERLDMVLNTAKNVVREAEALEVTPNPALADMAAIALDVVRELAAALPALAADPDQATTHADAAVAAERRMEKRYRAAMHDSLAIADLRASVNQREIYRRMLELGEAGVRVADRVWYAVVKEG
ncbi:DUF47 domain-containing protein [Oryzihumus leptocrescens]|uniref:DUF47 family protein n=1 Tax=Oryzihumus leptocrescens TaxID=297536 RepID=A0A542ZIV8_9MICO|nr:DUF47 family protein [Oryzihumus leptocrescens]TQL60239.1 hypothetical protein FB474_1622 [Oryzihumus leptocrescens]